MNTLIITGSHRKKSESLKVAHFVNKRISEYLTKIDCEIIELNNLNLPFWDESFWQKGNDWNDEWKNLSVKLREASGYIFIVPEYAGMVPPKLKNFLLLCSRNEVGHRPALIVSLSASQNGAYPIAEMRSYSYKNNYLCYLPEHLIIRNVGSVLNSHLDEISEEDRKTRERLDYLLMLYEIYVLGFQQITHSEVIINSKYKNGM